MTSAAELQAARLAGPLWAAICASGGLRPAAREHRHFRGAYDARWLAALPLPIGADRPSGQPVALLADCDDFDRHVDGLTLREAYSRHPRTRVYENINRDTEDAWYSVAARHLGRLARSELQVVCSVFESSHGDESLGGHWDAWYGAIVQLDGTKVWQIGESLLADTKQPARELITQAGDILLLPKGLPHAASTPQDPGRSVHLAFAIDRDQRPADGPLAGPPGRASGPRASGR